MKTLFALAVVTAFTVGGTIATAAEVPSYELMGFPITAHQFLVVGSADIQKQSATPSLVLGGMRPLPIR